MNLISGIKSWWFDLTDGDDVVVDRESLSWLISLALHLVILILLATLAYLMPVTEDYLLSSQPYELEEITPITEVEFSDIDPEEIGTLGNESVADAEAAAPIEAEFSEILNEIDPVTLISDLPAMAEMTLMTAPNPHENKLVKGTGSVGTTAASGAVDRITNEILLSIEQRPTLVVWLFDESGSLQSQRKAISERFNRIYEELGVIEASGNPAFRRDEDKPLLTAVASFEADMTIHTPEPTGELAEVQEAMKSIERKAAKIYQSQDSATGKENVFAAVGKVAAEFRKYRTKSPRRNVMIVAFTDEAGNDYNNLDPAIEICKKSVIPVYVVGVPAPFGRRQAYVKYVDPDPKYDQTPQYVPVDQGPESLMAERVQLRFFGRNEADDRVESGFGPFGLSRLTYETGGIYFSVHPNRRDGHVSRYQTQAMATHIAKFFDPLIMRGYRPDYVPLSEYQRRLGENLAKSSLVQAARMSWAEQMEEIRLRFPKADEAELARSLTDAQRAAAKLEPKLIKLAEVLKRGQKDRDDIDEPRWQAGYDLAIGRTLAAKVRTEGYNTMLAMAKQGMKFKNPRNDTWVLKPSSVVSSGSVLSNEADLAQMYLERVVAEHEETPWAYLASKELETPFGWEWDETFTNVVARRQNAGNGNGNNRPNPRPAKVAPKKPKRPVPKL